MESPPTSVTTDADASRSSKVDSEYARCVAVQDALQLMTSNLNQRTVYEVRNAMERWLVGLANEGPTQRDPILSERALNQNHPLTSKLLSEMRDKRVPDVHRRLSSALSPLRTYLHTSEYPRVLSMEVDPRGVVVVGTLLFRLDPLRLASLLSRTPNHTSLYALLLRYQSLLPGGQQWAVPSHVYSFLVEHFQVTVEGFATPLNARCTLLDATRYPNQVFCSLFPDTDTVYGSLGNFFGATHYSRHTYCNPPFTPSVLLHTAQFVTRVCSEAGERQARFFVVVPEWSDADWFLLLQSSPHRVFETSFARGTHSYVDTNAAPEVTVPASFNTHLFVLAVNTPVATSYTTLTSMWKR